MAHLLLNCSQFRDQSTENGALRLPSKKSDKDPFMLVVLSGDSGMSSWQSWEPGMVATLRSVVGVFLHLVVLPLGNHV